MKFLRWAMIGLCCLQLGSAYAKECPGVGSEGGPSFYSMLISALQRTPPPDEISCSSLLSVLDKIKRRDKLAGRRLEKDKPFDPGAAQADMDTALQDPEIKTRIETMHSQIKDQNVRLVYEAAILDEEGYYDARELIIQRLRKKVN